MIEKGQDHRVVGVVESFTAEDGSQQTRTNKVTELGNSMHYWDGQNWQESDPTLDIVDGEVLGVFTPHAFGVQANINVQGAVTLISPDNKIFTSTPLFLALRSLKSGQTVLVGQLKNSQAEVVEGNQVVFRDAMEGLNCSLLYINRVDGMEQNLVMHEPINPEDYGFATGADAGDDRDQVQLELWTEFFDAPTSKAKVTSADGQADVYLDFGATRIGTGKAFLLEGDSRQVPVAKRFGQVEGGDGRLFMVEIVQFESVRPLMDTLQGADINDVGEKVKRMARRHVGNNRDLLAQYGGKLPKEKLLAGTATYSDSPVGQGLVLDYQTVTAGTVGQPMVFRSDMTYSV